jgi:hypothetical protein
MIFMAAAKASKAIMEAIIEEEKLKNEAIS